MFSREKNNLILNKWQQKYFNIPLLFDGPCNDEIYLSQEIKIVVCLREANVYSRESIFPDKLIYNQNWFRETIDMAKETGNGTSGGPTYNNLTKLLALFEGKSCDQDFSSVQVKKDIFSSVAVLNVSKIGGCGTQSPWFEKIRWDNKELIKEQLDNLDWNLLIWCGSKDDPEFYFTYGKLDDESKYNRFDLEENIFVYKSKQNNRTILFTGHPSDVYRFNRKFDEIQKYLQQISPSPDATV